MAKNTGYKRIIYRNCCSANNNNNYLPIKQFAVINFLTVSQVKVLLRKHRVDGIFLKNRMFCKWNANYLEIIRVLNNG